MGVIRFLLALSVVAAHCGPILGTTLVSGQLAVQAFYIISGFYMSLVLDTKYNYKGSYWMFLEQRVLRLYPVYYLVALVTLIASYVAAVISGVHYPAVAQVISFYPSMSVFSKIFVALIQFTVVGQDITLFTGMAGTPLHLYFTSNFRLTSPRVVNFLLVPQTWTVALEMMFYVLAPFLCRLRLRTTLLLIGVSLSIRYFAYWSLGLAHEPWTYRFFPFELGFFLSGSVAYKFYRCFKSELENHKVEILVLFGGLVTFTIFYKWIQHVPSQQHLYYLCVALLVPGLFAIFKDNPVDRFIGELSYPIYLTHYVINYYLQHWTVRHFSPFYRGLVVAIPTVFVSAVIFLLFEHRMDRFRYWLFKRRKAKDRVSGGVPFPRTPEQASR
jgi:peptidoglycan/LPS O-acetylase OafA/YrhL